MNNTPETSSGQETSSGLAGWWNAASTTMKIVVIAAIVVIVAALLVIFVSLLNRSPGDGDGGTPPAQVTVTVVPTAAPGVPTVTATANTEIRTGPGEEYPIIGILGAGLTAEVVGVSFDGQWWAINYPPGPEGVGWVANADVGAKNTDDVPVVVAPPVPTPTTAPPTSFAGWKGEYYDNQNLQGEPVLVRDDAQIDFDWGKGSPAPEVPEDDFSARWTITRDLAAGTYRFSVWVDDGVRVWVDDTMIIDGWVEGNARNYTADINLAQGAHSARVEYFEAVGNAMIQLSIGYVQPTPEPQAPTAVITAPPPPDNAFVGDNIQFIGDQSFAVEGSQIVSYQWDFGDGTGSTDINPMHSYANPGNYQIVLTVVDDKNLGSTAVTPLRIDQVPETVTPTPPPAEGPTAVIIAPGEAQTGQVVTFNGNESSGDNPISAYRWDFGDGSTANAVTVDHVYNKAGDFNVTLTVTDNVGLSSTALHRIGITSPAPGNPPTAIISAPAEAATGETVTFDGSASSGDSPLSSFLWDFGDGTSANGPVVTHVYGTAGVFNVGLTVTDDQGLSGNAGAQITVRADVEPTPTPPPGEPDLEGVTWSLNNTLEGTQITALFENGTLSGNGGCNPYHATYQLDGTNLSIGPISGTGQACDDAIMQQEAGYFAALGVIDSYQVSGNQLTLFGTGGNLDFTALVATPR